MTGIAQIQDAIFSALAPPGRRYWAVVAFCAAGTALGGWCWWYQIVTGLGVAGVMHPVMWGTYLVNFVYWVGIAHAGTLISAILFLARGHWRGAVGRAAEATTVFAVAIAGLFPLIHLGRVWVVYWIMPYPNQMLLWPNFQSPLVMDVLAVSAYLVVSVLFWYTGLIPDLAAARDTFRGLRGRIYGWFALGWTGTSRQWKHHAAAYMLFAGLATTQIVLVSSIVSWDFSLTLIPGYHSTIFAPYFVLGAIHSGLAMVIVVMIPLRSLLNLREIIPESALRNLAKMMIFTASCLAYIYILEHGMALYGGDTVEETTFILRATGWYRHEFWIMLVFNVALPLTFIRGRWRASLPWLFVVSVLVNVGMWTERYVIVVQSMATDFIPYAWGEYWPTRVDYGILFGSFCMFFLGVLLFAKFIPPVSLTDLKEEALRREGGGHAA